MIKLFLQCFTLLFLMHTATSQAAVLEAVKEMSERVVEPEGVVFIMRAQTAKKTAEAIKNLHEQILFLRKNTPNTKLAIIIEGDGIASFQKKEYRSKGYILLKDIALNQKVPIYIDAAAAALMRLDERHFPQFIKLVGDVVYRLFSLRNEQFYEEIMLD